MEDEIVEITSIDLTNVISDNTIKLNNKTRKNEDEIYEKRKQRKERKKREKIIAPFERSSLVRYNNEVYHVLSYYIVREYFQMINGIRVEILENSKKDKIYYTIGLLDGFGIEPEIESSELTKIDSEESKRILFTHAVNLYNQISCVKKKIECVDEIITMFDKIKMNHDKFFTLINIIRNTENDTYNIYHIIENPYDFIQEDWSLFTYDEALLIENEYGLTIDDEIKRKALSYMKT
jgi:hypothetical protein